nr:hypothetical protein Iba_chr12aCG2370 [Ipomoea batatas]
MVVARQSGSDEMNFLRHPLVFRPWVVSPSTNGAAAAISTMASPVLPFPGDEHSDGSTKGPFRRVRQDRESFVPLISETQGSNDGAGISAQASVNRGFRQIHDGLKDGFE